AASAGAWWGRCSGRWRGIEIAGSLGLEAVVVEGAVDELRQAGLLDGPAVMAGNGYSRREAALSFAKIGGAAVAAPLIYSVAIPSAAVAGNSCAGTIVACSGVGSGEK